jgi:methanogenic corrinoid protein MtbC1
MRSRGLRVLDLGVNVPPEKFVEAICFTQAPILCLSGLITQAYESMKNTITLLEHYSLKKQTTVIIGGLVNSEINTILGSDYWVNDATSGMRLCKKIIDDISVCGTKPSVAKGAPHNAKYTNCLPNDQ